MVARAIVSLVLVLGPAFASAAQANGVGRAVIVRGSVGVARGSGESVSLVIGDRLQEGDTVEVGEHGFARLLMKDGSLLDLGSGTRIALSVYEYSQAAKRRRASLRVFIGRVWARIAKAFAGEPSYVLNSDNAVAGVRGTELVFDVAQDGTADLVVVEGSVALTSKLTGASDLFGALTRGQVTTDGTIRRGSATPEQIEAMRSGQRPAPVFDGGGKDSRLDSVRERLGVEVTPEAPAPVPAPRTADEPEPPAQDPFERLDDLKDNPAEPLIDFEPDVGATKVRGTVEVVEP